MRFFRKMQKYKIFIIVRLLFQETTFNRGEYFVIVFGLLKFAGYLACVLFQLFLEQAAFSTRIINVFFKFSTLWCMVILE